MEKIKNNIFFLLKEGSIVLWDYENHQQYRLSKDYLERIVDIAQGAEIVEDAISADLRASSVLSPSHNKPPEWGWDDLSWIFHQGTKNPPFVESHSQEWFKAYLTDCGHKTPPELDLKSRLDQTKIDLFPFDPTLFKNALFLDVLDQRTTSREFTSEEIDFKSFSSLLYKSFAYMKDPWGNDSQIEILGRHKVSASAGGLHPFNFYIIVNAVETIDPGLYIYAIEEHALYLQKTGDFRQEMIHCVSGQDFAKELSFGIFLVADFRKVWWKYEHSRGYRHVLLDAGHQSQTFLLMATALQLLTWVTGALDDRATEDFLEISESYLSPMLFLGAGKGEPKTLSTSMLSQILSNN
ncbi:SagB/ThcOx family dehydrogenase [Candidatus Bealeia paramacronuclearis]|uniref:SagB/ThcOx family dehydrogenase n=1 Tax=Candidatus Bealeia paramacronuclearis TaxID=1921001 RepID=A0ABZ2C3N7_9PROT|nr:SagB/ThcOx family dehydrogenase [Candidatus Bealeia paramacronuclearis]